MSCEQQSPMEQDGCSISCGSEGDEKWKRVTDKKLSDLSTSGKTEWGGARGDHYGRRRGEEERYDGVCWSVGGDVRRRQAGQGVEGHECGVGGTRRHSRR
ncbi:hypothetical protein PR003_g10107 [Phytophthora rubi]|uniref:Uncharacterized protein n=1 Tax=Phytophthora rubi TaxID=129364 RepID=A0A6A4FCC8_9STRA|nr:hypothetical protein PR003_g10107 [Phytophthora rubi]